MQGLLQSWGRRQLKPLLLWYYVNRHICNFLLISVYLIWNLQIEHLILIKFFFLIFQILIYLIFTVWIRFSAFCQLPAKLCGIVTMSDEPKLHRGLSRHSSWHNPAFRLTDNVKDGCLVRKATSEVQLLH